MKRAVFISVLSLLGLHSPGHPFTRRNLNTSSCDALCVRDKSFSNFKLSKADRSESKDQYVIGPINKQDQSLVNSPANTSFALAPEALYIKLWPRSHTHVRKRSKKQEGPLPDRLNTNKKAPP